jgi:hypothetical protein
VKVWRCASSLTYFQTFTLSNPPPNIYLAQGVEKANKKMLFDSMRFFFFATLLMASFLGLRAQECPCEPKNSPQEAIVAADIIFVGKLLRAETNWMSGGMKYAFEVERTWKMDADRMLYVNSEFERDCGYAFREGERYLVYANKLFTTKKTDSCSGSKPLLEAEADLAILGQGSPTQTPASLNRAMWTMGLLIVGGILFLVLVVLRKKLIRPKT